MKKFYFFSLLLSSVLSNPVFGQFTITNTLRTKESAGLKIGDNAYLTASKGVDVNGDGWMRLTEAKTNQKGYMYVQQSFPTTLGLTVDFEYVAWRDVADGTNYGADGFTMFLFNGNITEQAFKLGGYGGSLGYATFINPLNTTGLSGGYLGIGFDAYGNYVRNAEARNGGETYFVPNAIVLRGPTTDVYEQSNMYLTRRALGNQTLPLENVRQRNEIDYNTIVAKRPLPSVFYRRVQITITKPTSSTDYLIEIKWRKENQTTFTNVLNYTLDSSIYPIPERLKMGFAGGTGGGFNYQEIRNIILTTPGNLRVDSRSDISYVCNVKKSPIVFKVEVTNDTPTAINDIKYSTKVVDNNGVLLDLSKFKISNVALSSGFTSSTLPTSNFTTNEVKGVVGLGANASGIVTITGEYLKGIKTNSNFKTETTIDTTVITDKDPTNNTSFNIIDVRKCSVPSNPNLPTTYK